MDLHAFWALVGRSAVETPADARRDLADSAEISARALRRLWLANRSARAGSPRSGLDAVIGKVA